MPVAHSASFAWNPADSKRDLILVERHSQQRTLSTALVVLSIKVKKKERITLYSLSWQKWQLDVVQFPIVRRKKVEQIFVIVMFWCSRRDFTIKFSDQCFHRIQSYNNVIAALRSVFIILSSRWPPFPCFLSAGFLVDAALLCAILRTIRRWCLYQIWNETFCLCQC